MSIISEIRDLIDLVRELSGKYGFSVSKIFFILLLVLGIVGTIYIFPSINKNERSILKKFNLLDKLLTESMDQYFPTYLKCKNYLISSKQENEEIAKKQINKLRIVSKAATDQHKLLGKLVSLQTYCHLHEYTSYISNLTTVTPLIEACRKKMVQPEKMAIIRTELSNLIGQDERKHSRLIYKIYDYITYKDTEKYTPNLCAGVHFLFKLNGKKD